MTDESRAPHAPISQAERDQVLDRFESVWQTGSPPAIADFLPHSPVARRELLTELIMIDLEYRWRRSQPMEPKATSVLPRLESYLEHFPDLEPLLCAELIAEEYRVRQRWGDRPDHAEYTRRFPRQAAELASALAQIDAELQDDPLVGIENEQLPGGAAVGRPKLGGVETTRDLSQLGRIGGVKRLQVGRV